MTSRERILAAFRHRKTDRVPIDLGTNVTSIHRDAYRALRTYLGLPEKEPEIIDKMQQAAKIDEDVLDYFHVDTRQLHLRGISPWVKEKSGLWRDEWGIGWKLSPDGAYYDMAEHPLQNLSPEEIDMYRFPDPDDPRRFAGLEEEARRLGEETGCALVLNGFGECVFGMPAFLRGHIQFYMDLIDRSEHAEKCIRRMVSYNKRLLQNALTRVGKYVTVVRIADDLGTEKGPIISPELYRECIKPGQRDLCSTIKEYSEAKILLHTCGAVGDFIPDFIEIGIDAVNPVQTSAYGMEPRALKAAFGDKITFWGGGSDTQRTVPFGNIEEIQQEVRERIEIFAPGGGFIFTPIHNIQPDVAPEKIEAIYKSAYEYRLD